MSASLIRCRTLGTGYHDDRILENISEPPSTPTKKLHDYPQFDGVTFVQQFMRTE